MRGVHLTPFQLISALCTTAWLAIESPSLALPNARPLLLSQVAHVYGLVGLPA